jgi:hypothetical protein
MFRSRLIRLAAVLGAVVALAGCGTSKLQAPQTQDIKAPIFEAVTRDSALLATISTDAVTDSVVVDGASGGSLTVGSFRLEIPAGAFKGLATVSITQPDASMLVCDIHISPIASNAFAIPVTLSTKLPDSIALTDQMLWYDPTQKSWQVIASVSDSARVELHAQLWHFSKYGCSRAGW